MDFTELFANLRKRNVVFIWLEKQQKAFDRLKEIMAKKLVVNIFFILKGHYVNHRCKQTFNIWNIITRRKSYNVRGAYDKFPDFFRMGTFIDSTHMKL